MWPLITMRVAVRNFCKTASVSLCTPTDQHRSPKFVLHAERQIVYLSLRNFCSTASTSLSFACRSSLRVYTYVRIRIRTHYCTCELQLLRVWATYACMCIFKYVCVCVCLCVCVCIYIYIYIYKYIYCHPEQTCKPGGIQKVLTCVTHDSSPAPPWMYAFTYVCVCDLPIRGMQTCIDMHMWVYIFMVATSSYCSVLVCGVYMMYVRICICITHDSSPAPSWMYACMYLCMWSNHQLPSKYIREHLHAYTVAHINSLLYVASRHPIHVHT